MVIGCRRKWSGRKRRGAGWSGNGFRGVTRFRGVRRIILVTPCRLIRMVCPTTLPRQLIMIQPLATVIILLLSLSRVPWGILLRIVMDYTTWRGMWMRGVGIGMGRRMVNPLLLIQQARHLGAAVFCVAAIGATKPTSRGAPIAPTTTRSASTATLGSGV